jgi:hypothetical protein
MTVLMCSEHIGPTRKVWARIDGEVVEITVPESRLAHAAEAVGEGWQAACRDGIPLHPTKWFWPDEIPDHLPRCSECVVLHPLTHTEPKV